ncbi:putative calcium-binding protein [Candidatus Magnetomoraceae bacterium gMMP-15]
MKKFIVIAVILAIGWYGNYSYRQDRLKLAGVEELYADISKPEVSSNSSGFKCDGRIYCSQMTSCEEAIFFINNCPGTKMDRDNDGIPCEKQWYGQR